MVSSAPTREAPIHRLWKTAAWLLALLGVAFALSAAQVAFLDWAGSRVGSAASPLPATAAKPASLFEPTTVVDPLGRFPSRRVTYDGGVRGRLYAVGERSDDGGRSWQPLTGRGHEGVVLLGGDAALAPGVGPAGRLLFGEVLFDEPGVASGPRRIAHAVEWQGGRWARLGPDDREPLAGSPGSGPGVRGIGYLPDGRAVVATRDRVLVGGETLSQCPTGMTALLVTTSGTLYVAVDDPGRFSLYRADGPGAPWLPVAGMGRVDGLAEGIGGRVYVASGARLGRGSGSDWAWSALPAGLVPEAVAAHPRAPLVAVWGDRRLAISRDGGATLVACPLKDLPLAWAAWDPFATDSLTVLDPEANAYRLKLESVR
jgi:hypothetical protein